MAKLTRKLLKLFGGDGATTYFAKYGSEKAGSPVKTKDIELIQDLPAWDNGWQNATIQTAKGKVPLLQDLNGLLHVHGYELAYLLQEGISEWNILTSYYIGSVVKKTGTFELYGSRINDNLGNSLPNQTDNANWAYLGTLQTRQNSGFKNKIINGNFDIWQRGTSFPSGNEYTADCWYLAGVTGSIDRQSFALGQTDVPGEPKYYSRGTVTGASQNSELFSNRMESVRTLANKTVTVSFYSRLNSGSLTFEPRLVQNFGTGGSPSATVVTILGTFSPTSSWQKFVYTINLPSIVGKTLGTDGNDYLSFDLIIADTNIGVLDLARVQVEEGTVATEFERRNIEQELIMCKRRFKILDFFSSGWITSATTANCGIFFDLMRKSPSLSQTANWTIRYGPGGQQSGAASFADIGNSSARVTITVSGLTTNDPCEMFGGVKVDADIL